MQVRRILEDDSSDRMDELPYSEIHYRELFEQSPVPMIEADWSGVKVELDKLKSNGVINLSAHFAARPSEVSRLRRKIVRDVTNDSILRLFHAETHEDFERYVSREVEEIDRYEIYFGAFSAFNEGLNCFEFEGKEFVADGAQIITSTRFYLPPNSREDWRHVLITIEDISARKSTEESVLKRQRQEAVRKLTGGVAHEFNNLLTIIQGCTEFLATTSEQDSEMVQHILDATQRGAQLTYGLLAYSRQQQLGPKSVDLKDIIERFRETLEPALGQTITIEHFAPRNLWPAWADPKQIDEALRNLTTNAIEAMPHGGLLKIESANVEIDGLQVSECTEASPGDYVMLAVTDTGRGMSETVLSQAFEPFFSTKGVAEGCGLGLSMVYGFARQSGGHTKLQSLPGNGTRVEVYLPRNLLAVNQPEQMESNFWPSRSGKVVLVIEDDETVCDLTAKALEALGFETLIAANVAEARQTLLSGAQVDIVLSDVVLSGGTSGLEFAVQAKELRPGIEVIFMSGCPDNILRFRLLPGQENVLLSKPFGRDQLGDALDGALRRSVLRSDRLNTDANN